MTRIYFTPLYLITFALAAAPRGEAALIAMLDHPIASTVSSEFNGSLAGSFLHDGTATLSDVGTSNNLGGEWAGVGTGPHVMVFDMGASVNFNGVFYAQREDHEIQFFDKVLNIEFWTADSDPGSASNSMPILSAPVEHDLNVGGEFSNILTGYDFGEQLDGRWVVMRFTGIVGGNSGGSELVLGTSPIPEPGSAALVGVAAVGLLLRRGRGANTSPDSNK